ncbi:MAG: DUF2076 family protein [Nevskia sp.]|nr:DUF2076 family protein [Nevskia sp.]
MNDTDRASLQDFLARLRSARLPERDAEAARLIEETFQVQPDAAQLLTIKCLLQQRALDELRGQVEALQQQLAQAQTAAPGGQGSTQDRGWFARLMGAPPRQPAQPMAPPPGPAYGQAYAAPAYGAAPGGSLLGSIATTAAGVAAGEFLFEGVEHLLHGGRGYGYGYGPGAFMDPQPVVENVTINEFGGQPQPAFDLRQGDYGADAGFQNVGDAGGFDGGGFDDSFSGGDGDISI